MAYDVGTAVLHVVPSFRGIEDELKGFADRVGKQISKSVQDQLRDAVRIGVQDGADGVTRETRELGKQISDSVSKNVAKGVTDGVKGAADDAAKAADGAAKKTAGVFERRMRDGLSRVMHDLPDIAPDIKLEGDAEWLRELRGEVGRLLKGTNEQLVSPETLEWIRQLRAEFNRLSREASSIKVRIEADTAFRDLDDIFAAMVTTAEEEARQVERERQRIIDAAHAEALRTEAEMLRTRERMLDASRAEILRRDERLATQRQRIIDAAHAEALRVEAEMLRRRERLLESARADIVRRDERLATERQRIIDAAHAEALREEEAFQRDVQRIINETYAEEVREADRRMRDYEREVQRRAQAAEQAFNQTWAGRIRKAITAAYTGIPDLRLAVDATPAERSLRWIRNEMEHLANLRIGVDVDADAALQRVADLRAALIRLANSRAEVEVRAAAAQAIDELRQVSSLADRLDGRHIGMNVDVNALGAVAQMRALGDAAEVNIGRLGALIVTVVSLGPALVPLAAVAVSSIGAIGTAAIAAASGVGVLALAFSGVFDAVKALNDYQENARKSAVALSAAHARVASAQDAVAAATRSLANTQAQVAAAARRAAEAVTDAQRAAARARRDAAEAVANANRRVEDSERSLARAQVDAREARDDLTEAYKRAVDRLADLDSAVKRNALDQREATLEIQRAKEELDRILSNPRATEEQREQARITYERQLLQMQDLQREGQRLGEEQAEAARKGVEGSDEVTSARARLLDAEQRVADAQRAVADARAQLVQAHLDGAERVADAERRVAEAQQAASEQQRQAAFQVQQAQQSVISAQRQLGEAIKSSSVAGGEALDNLRKAMENLSPAGQRFARFIFGLKDEFDQLRATAADNMLPGVQSAIESALPHLPKFNEYVGKVAKAIGDLFDKTAGVMTTDPTWRRFWKFVGDETVPMMERLWDIGEKLSRGLLGLFMAFTPFNDDVGEGLSGLAGDFAEWATTLDQNKGFQDFLAYVRKEAPTVIAALKEIAIFAGRFVVAAAPIGVLVLEGFRKLFEMINKIPIDVLTVVIGAIGATAAAIGVLGAVTALFASGVAAAILMAVGAVAAGVIILFNKLKPFRDWVALQLDLVTGWFDVVRKSLKVFVDALVWLFREQLAPAFSWLYSHVFKPVWDRIVIAFRFGVAAIQVAFGLFQIAVKVISAIWRGFYHNTILPVWRLIEPIFGWLGGLIDKEVRPKWDSSIKVLGKIWDGLVEATKKPIRFVVNTVLNDGIFAAYNKVAKLFNVKPQNVKIDLPPGFADGGAIIGPGTGVSDSILARLSNGEHVWTAAEVRAAGGHEAVESLRQAVLRGPRGFRRGGGVGDGIGDLFRAARKKATDVIEGVTDFFRDPVGKLKELARNLLKVVPGQGSLPVRLLEGVTGKLVDGLVDRVKSFFGRGEDGNPTGGPGNSLGGSAGMMRILRQAFPGLRLLSGYRPGSRTLTGNVSYHASDRAVDVPPIEAVARWINETFGPRTRELITPWHRWNLHNGRPHIYTGAVWNQHNWAGGNAHVHWAYDSGGMLPPGVSTVLNATGKPEPVLTDQQWRDLTAAARNNHAEARETHHWHFKEAALDHGRLNAWADARDARARPGRPN